MASEESASRSGDDGILRLPQVVECPKCGIEFDHVFEVEAIDKEQIREPPTAELTCPDEDCGHKWTEEYGGFIQYGYA